MPTAFEKTQGGTVPASHAQDRTTSQQGGWQMPASWWLARRASHLDWAWGNGYTFLIFLFGRLSTTQEGTLTTMSEFLVADYKQQLARVRKRVS